MHQFIAGAAQAIIGAKLPMTVEVGESGACLVVGIGGTDLKNTHPFWKLGGRESGRAVGANLVAAHERGES